MRSIILITLAAALSGCGLTKDRIAELEANLWTGNPTKVIEGKQGAITRTEQDKDGVYKRHLSTQNEEFERFFCIWEPDFEREVARLAKDCTCVVPKDEK